MKSILTYLFLSLLIIIGTASASNLKSTAKRFSTLQKTFKQSLPTESESYPNDFFEKEKEDDSLPEDYFFNDVITENTAFRFDFSYSPNTLGTLPFSITNTKSFIKLRKLQIWFNTLLELNSNTVSLIKVA